MFAFSDRDDSDGRFNLSGVRSRANPGRGQRLGDILNPGGILSAYLERLMNRGAQPSAPATPATPTPTPTAPVAAQQSANPFMPMGEPVTFNSMLARRPTI